MKQVTLANGCFWCTEAVFQRVRGISEIKSGFSGGKIKNPPYREVVEGRTGHAEALQFTYNPEQVSYEEILHIFFATHDPTTLNRQGNDVGTQYRSAIFFEDEQQKEIAHKVIEELNREIFENKIVTEVTAYTNFYEAEFQHQNFYNNNPRQPYCQIIINPKLKKLRESFAYLLNE
ncbi:peptide-methionine (S)-S-oxide reductase MsrA [Mesonia ostreae]|uniref:Peptide methionine sulfoxide reductase MsrA n=1 Tax=Mesonia ostreae TaxID=861110 RepID=A0ABU2KED9_9FLAO|nr:peptide-methionine (S)-S-oxide reductase MsrA [Mesonia ostreae]MDT0293076.1 peptide-methionine (S)-S-oxide reductase MsrA [Mesonia ostreae]